MYIHIKLCTCISFCYKYCYLQQQSRVVLVCVCLYVCVCVCVCNKKGWVLWLYTDFNINFEWVCFLNIKSREVWCRNTPAVNFHLHCILSTFINSSRTTPPLDMVWCLYIHIYIHPISEIGNYSVGFIIQVDSKTNFISICINFLEIFWKSYDFVSFGKSICSFSYLTYTFLYFFFSLFTITMLATLISLVRNGKEFFFKVDGKSHVEIKKRKRVYGENLFNFSSLVVSWSLVSAGLNSPYKKELVNRTTTFWFKR